MDKNNKQSGFVMLMSSIIISAVLVAVVFSISFSGFFTRFNLLDSYNKEASLALAEACGNIAILKKVQNSSYAGGESLAIGSETCTVNPITGLEIKTTANKDGAISNILINLNSSFVVTRWREVPSF